MSAQVIRDGDHWGVQYLGRLVVQGESFTVATNVADALNGIAQPSGECADVARSILATTNGT